MYSNRRAPYELILVDNGSTDGTLPYLEEIQRRTGPERVVIIRNQENLGFAKGCNQGLKAAKGDYLILLNNDTIVTGGWLESLITLSLNDWPHIGLVGPVSNEVAPPQQIPVDYRTIDGIDAFARRRQQQFAGQAMRVDRLIGFCLLIRRDVLAKIGYLDEGFGLGFFEDDDLCVRAREAGYRLAVALDTFIHHFGNRTFMGLGIDAPAQLQKNFEKFKAKWGPERAAGYRLPEPEQPLVVARNEAPTGGSAGQRPQISLCMIVRNEEGNLPECLQSVHDLADEIVLVDTGSSDRTKEIARQFEAKIVDFPWVDSFAAARNESLQHAHGDWIFWMDADDRLDAENRTKLRRLLDNLPDQNVGFVMKCLCLPEAQTGTETVVDHVRLFRNHPEIRWKHRVHEQILPAIRAAGGTVHWSDVVIYHVGYQDPAVRRRKQERDLRLLDLENSEEPNHPFTLFNLGSVYHEQGEFDKALQYLEPSLQLSNPSDSIVRKLWVLIAQCRRSLGRLDEALATCQDGRRHYPHDVELLFVEGTLRDELGDQYGAETCWLQLLQVEDGDHFASVATGLKGFKSRHNLAMLYQQAHRHAEAEAQWQAALAEQPRFIRGWLGLAEIYLRENLANHGSCRTRAGIALASKRSSRASRHCCSPCPV